MTGNRALRGTCVVVAATALVAASIGVVVLAASPAAASTQSITDPVGDDCHPGLCDVGPLPQGDVISASADYTDGIITLSLAVLKPTDPSRDPNWANGASGAGWDIGVTGETVGLGAVDYSVTMIYAGGLVASVSNSAGAGDITLCSASPTFDGTTYQVSFPASCIGSPPQFWWEADMAYRTGPSLFDETFDTAPSEVQINGVWTEMLTGPVSAVTATTGYWMLGTDGSVYPFGNALHGPSAPITGASASATHIEPTPDGAGYWVVDTLGHVFTAGDAGFFGGSPPLGDAEAVTSMSATTTGNGYWLFTSKGRVFPFGDAKFLGDMSGVRLNGPVIDSVRTPSGNGYYMVAQDGGIFTFGDARFQGSMGGQHLNGPVVGIAPDAASGGYWLVGSDGGIFSFGGAAFRGSMGGSQLNRPVIGVVAYGNGYLMVGIDGGIFNFSDQPFVGSLGANPPRTR